MGNEMAQTFYNVRSECEIEREKVSWNMFMKTNINPKGYGDKSFIINYSPSYI